MTENYFWTQKKHFHTYALNWYNIANGLPVKIENRVGYNRRTKQYTVQCEMSYNVLKIESVALVTDVLKQFLWRFCLHFFDIYVEYR